MEYGICNLAVVPLRAEPDERSEQISQVLFGEAFEIIEWTEGWAQIITAVDNYKGWINRLQFIMLGHLNYQHLQINPPKQTYKAITQAWKIRDNSVLYLPAGSSLSFLNGTTCYLEKEKFEIIGQIGQNESIDLVAKSFLNTPYLWGGRTHFGIDCSGFTQMVFKLKGYKLNRDAWMQAGQGRLIETLSSALIGDLAFFKNESNKITHVGILLNREHIIHASGKVKIDIIDEKGIYSEEESRYTHKLAFIRRIF
jgi:Cell wall-associated hydrolases (invasion-associated proteins)